MNENDEQLNLWANGKLPEAERVAFEQKMAEDPALAREAEFAKTLRAGMREDPMMPPGELGLARLQKAIREEQPDTPKVLPRKDFWKPVAIAACLIVAIQAGLLLGPKPWDEGTTVDVSPASGEAVSTGPRLQIVFDPAATMADVQESILSVNGSIVAGPSALGIFRLQLPQDASANIAAERLREFEFVDEVITP